nr:MAG TPA: hypothetical protein [Caudoviricetes sp.]
MYLIISAISESFNPSSCESLLISFTIIGLVTLILFHSFINYSLYYNIPDFQFKLQHDIAFKRRSR